MFRPLKNSRKLVGLIRREIARSYLYEVAPEHLKTYPQMCCYSFDRIAIDLNVDGRFERVELKALIDLVAPLARGKTVVDIGANIGNHSAAFAAVAGQVIALEPHPLTFELLKLNVQRLANVTAINVGASDAVREVRAISSRINYGSTMITSRPLGADESEWHFSVAPIDSRPEIIESDICLMKIDVECHELEALRGARETIRKNRPVIVFEQNQEVISAGSSDSFEFLKSSGYTHFYSLDVEMPWRTPKALPGPVRKFLRIAESLAFGPVDYEPLIRPLDRLEQRHYPMLIASFEPLATRHIVARAQWADVPLKSGDRT